MPEPKFYTTTFFTGHLLAIETKATEILINKPIYLGLSILELINMDILQVKKYCPLIKDK